MSVSSTNLIPPRILEKKAAIKMKTKNLFNQLKGPSVLDNGSVNQVKIMKEEQGFQKMFDNEVFPLCLEGQSPKLRRNSHYF